MQGLGRGGVACLGAEVAIVILALTGTTAASDGWVDAVTFHLSLQNYSINSHYDLI